MKKRNHNYCTFKGGIICCVLIIGLQSTLLGQKTEHDWVNWSGIGLNYSPTKSIGFSIDQQLRFDNNINSFKSSFTEIGTSIKASNVIRFSFSYRFTVRNKFQQNKQRFSSVLSLKPQLNNSNFKLSFRLKHQYNYVWNRSESNNDLRAKISLKYDRKKWAITPFTAAELFYDMSHLTEKLSRIRGQVGIEYPFKKQWNKLAKKSIELRYIFQHELNSKIPEAAHIIALGINFSFKPNKKGKEKLEKAIDKIPYNYRDF